MLKTLPWLLAVSARRVEIYDATNFSKAKNATVKGRLSCCSYSAFSFKSITCDYIYPNKQTHIHANIHKYIDTGMLQ
jgi:hypothetical protein